MAGEEEILLPPPPKKGIAPIGDGELLLPPPRKKKIQDSTGTLSQDFSEPIPEGGLDPEAFRRSSPPTIPAPSEPYNWDEVMVKPQGPLPAASTTLTAKPEQQTTGTPSVPTKGHAPELKMIAVDPEKKLPEQKAKENPAFESIQTAFLEMPDLFSDVGSMGRNGKDKRIEFYKMAYEKSRGESKEFNAEEFESLVNESEKKFEDANELYQYNKLLEKNPDNLDYKYAVGFRQMNLGKTQEAVDNFKAIIAQNPKYSPAYSAMAYLYSDKGQDDVALTFMDDAIGSNPDDPALYSNRSIIKQRAGDVEGALKDLEMANGKTQNKSIQLEIEKQYSDIFQRLYQNRDSKTEKYIAIIKGEYNPQDAAVDQQFFKERWNEHQRNVLNLTKEVAAESEKFSIEKIKKGDYSDFAGTQDITVPEEMESYIRAKGQREALEAFVVDPKQAGIAGFIMNPVGFIVRGGIEGGAHGVSEIKKGLGGYAPGADIGRLAIEGELELKPLKIIKGAAETAIAGIMAVTPAGWVFTGTATGVEALPYGDVISQVVLAPITTIMGEESDAASIGDLIIGGALLHAVGKKMKGADKVLEKSKAKEPFTAEDMNVLNEAIALMPEPVFNKIAEGAGIPNREILKQKDISPEGLSKIDETAKAAEREDFVKAQMEELKNNEELSPDVLPEQYENYFRNQFDRKSVQEPSKKLTDAEQQTEHFGNISEAESSRLSPIVEAIEGKGETASRISTEEIERSLREAEQLIEESKKFVTTYEGGKAVRISLTEALKRKEAESKEAPKAEVKAEETAADIMVQAEEGNFTKKGDKWFDEKDVEVKDPEYVKYLEEEASGEFAPPEPAKNKKEAKAEQQEKIVRLTDRYNQLSKVEKKSALGLKLKNEVDAIAKELGYSQKLRKNKNLTLVSKDGKEIKKEWTKRSDSVIQEEKRAKERIQRAKNSEPVSVQHAVAQDIASGVKFDHEELKRVTGLTDADIPFGYTRKDGKGVKLEFYGERMEDAGAPGYGQKGSGADFISEVGDAVASFMTKGGRKEAIKYIDEVQQRKDNGGFTDVEISKLAEENKLEVRPEDIDHIADHLRELSDEQAIELAKELELREKALSSPEAINEILKENEINIEEPRSEGGKKEGATRNDEGGRPEKQKGEGEVVSEENSQSETLKSIVEKYDNGENYTIEDMVKDVESLPEEQLTQKLSDAIEKFREEQKYDREVSGRGDMDSARDAFESIVRAEAKKEGNKKEAKANPKSKSKDKEHDFSNLSRQELLKKNYDTNDVAEGRAAVAEMRKRDAENPDYFKTDDEGNYVFSEEPVKSNRATLEAELGRATSEMLKAQSEYDKVAKALSKDLGAKQTGMFEGTEQKLFEDTAEQKTEIKSEIESRKKALDIAKEKVDNINKRLGDTLEGQGELNVPVATQKAYENIAGLQPKSQVGRIAVEPIINGSVKDISKIIFDVSKDTKTRLFYGSAGSGRRSALGTYNPGNSAVKIKFNGDLDVTAHELGHSIDDLFGVLGGLEKNPNLPIEMELNKFSPFGSTPPKGHPNPRLYEYGEGFAEFLRALIVSPENAKAEAPNLFKMYEAKVSPEYRKAVDGFSKDIRTWAGSSGRDMVLSNVEWKPTEKKGIVGQILSKSESNNMFGITWADKLAANFVNPLRAFEKANDYAKGLKGIDELLPENDPVLLARTLLGVDGKVSEILESGMIDSEMNVLKDANGKAKNLNWLLETLDNTDMASIERDTKDVISYMVSERTVELAKKFSRESVLSGIGGGIFKDIDVAKKALDEFNARTPEDIAKIKEAAGRYREMADDVLKYMVDKGRLSKENYDQIKNDNTQYVAMQRVIEAEPGREIEVYSSGGGGIGSKTDVIKTIKGSTKKIQNPYTSLLDLIYKGVKESDRNESLLAFRNLLVPERVNMYDGTPLRLADIGTRAKAADKETITIFVDGKPEYWQFQSDVYKALKGLDSDGYKLPGVITALPRALRWSVTNFPVFAMRNVVRDFQDRIIKSNENSYKNLYGIKDLVGDKEHWNEVARAGGLNSGFYMKDKVHYYGLLESAMKDMAKTKQSIIVDPSRLKAGWEGYKSILQKSETINRVAEYRAAHRNAKSKGMDDYNAKLYSALKSRDLLDFALMGHWMRVVNQMIPFSNAAIQGTRSALARAKENPLGFTSRMVAFSVIPSVAVWMLNNKDKESSDQYNELPDYQRDMFYNFKIGPNNWASIPKPYELSLMGSAVDRGLSFFAGKKDAFEGYGGSVAKSVLPFDEASFAGGFQSIIEGTTNYDYFRDKAIVPPHEDALALALRDTERASRLGKALQDVSGIDARKMDHFIKGSFSYYGKTATEISDIGKDGELNPFTLGDLGFFKQSPAYNGKSVQEFLKVSKEGNFTSTHPYKEFGRLVKLYFKASTPEEKEKMGKLLNEYAKSTLPLMNKALEQKIKNKTE